MSSPEVVMLAFHKLNRSGSAFRCWNPNVASVRCSPVAILVQVLTRLAHVARIASAMRKRPAAKMCSQPRASSGVGASNGCVEDAQGLASGGNALGAAVAELSALNQRGLRARATSLGHPQIVHSQLSAKLLPAQIDDYLVPRWGARRGVETQPDASELHTRLLLW